MNRERILILLNCAKKSVLRRPLFYVLPLLAALYLIIIPVKIEFSDVKIARGDKTENVKLPYSVGMANNEVFFVSYRFN